MLAGEFLDESSGLLQLILLLLGIEVVFIDFEFAKVKSIPFLRVAGLDPAVHDLQQYFLIDFFPILEVIDDLMRSILVDEYERIHIFGVEYFEGVFEVELGQSGHERSKFLVLHCEFLLAFEYMSEHTSCPDGADRKKKRILPPLLLNLHIDFGK
jgi:hypothetical protein